MYETRDAVLHNVSIRGKRHMVSKVKFPKNIINGVLILLFSAIGNMLVALLKIDHGETYSVVQVQLWGSFWLVVVTFIIVVITYAYLLLKKSK